MDDFKAAGASMLIKPHRAKEILEQVELGVKGFKEYAIKARVPEQTCNVIQSQFEYFLL